MSTQRAYPKPGDLITADFFSAILDDLSAIEARVAKLELAPADGTPAPGAPVLLGTDPTGTVFAEQLLTLLGKNFSPIAQAHVKFGGDTVSKFAPGSDDKHLIFPVPAAFGQASGSPPVAITVETPQGTSTTLSIVVKPKIVTPNSGKVFLDDATPALGTIEKNKPYNLQWNVRSETVQPANYTFSLVISDVVPAGLQKDWEAGATLNAKTQQVSAGDPFDVVAEVKVPDAETQASIQLKTVSDDGLFQALSGPVLLKVGKAGVPSNPNIQLAVSDPQPDLDPDGKPNAVTLVTSEGAARIVVPKNSTGYVQVGLTFQDPAKPPLKYKFTVELEGAPSTWQIDKVRPAELTRNATGGSTRVNYGVKNTATDTAKHSAVLVAKATRTTGATDEYVSFVRIPIENG
jgi:hypothetical protein